MTFPTSKIEEKIGYIFADKGLLKTAFTHSTYGNLHGEKDNERMEYLGDAVLQLVVTEWQYITDKKDEGALTKSRQKLVCEDALYRSIKQLGMEKYLLLEGGKSNIGKKTVSSLFETIVAAIYLDGGYAKAQNFIYRFLLTEEEPKDENPKGELQEFLQSKGEELPTYLCQKSGEDHAPTFVCKATACGKSAVGKGSSKRQAEQNAARELLDKLV